MNLFRVRGIQLAVHWTFFLLIAYAAYQGWQPAPEDGWPGGWRGLVWDTIIVMACFTCVVLHELGHCFTAMRYGVNVRRILLMPIGGMAEFDSIPRRPSSEVLITIAGPAVNFLIAGLLWACVPLASPASTGFAAYLSMLVGTLIAWNLVMGCFNLVPVFPMDGGRILRALLARRLSYIRATAVAALVGKILAVGAIVIAIFLPELGLYPERAAVPAVLFCFIIFAGEFEYRAVRRQELEAAHWRGVWERLYAVPPSGNEPPVQP